MQQRQLEESFRSTVDAAVSSLTGPKLASEQGLSIYDRETNANDDLHGKDTYME